MAQGLAAFNGLPEEVARERLRACCAATAWVDALLASRPYPDRAALLGKATDTVRGLDWDAVREALDAHPRIGERLTAEGIEAAWSASEQSGMDGAT